MQLNYRQPECLVLQVCENDILVVDVINRLPGKPAAMHWRGQSQIETPFMDGAPLVTQCPIPSYTTFQYKFRASAAGTHLWHAHAGKSYFLMTQLQSLFHVLLSINVRRNRLVKFLLFQVSFSHRLFSALLLVYVLIN